MHSSINLLRATLSTMLVFHAVVAIDRTKDAELDTALKSAATQLDRLARLPTDSDWTYDFFQNPLYTWKPGSVVGANAATFPAATGMGMTLAFLNLGPCAMLPPHLHPRAANFVVAINGTTDTYMMQENGARMVHTVLTAGKMTIFPPGSFHTMQNRECTNTLLVSALNNDDAGTSNLANGLFKFPAAIVNAAFGNPEGGMKGHAQMPPVGTGSILGDQACVAKCRRHGHMS